MVQREPVILLTKGYFDEALDNIEIVWTVAFCKLKVEIQVVEKRGLRTPPTEQLGRGLPPLSSLVWSSFVYTF